MRVLRGEARQPQDQGGAPHTFVVNIGLHTERARSSNLHPEARFPRQHIYFKNPEVYFITCTTLLPGTLALNLTLTLTLNSV